MSRGGGELIRHSGRRPKRPQKINAINKEIVSVRSRKYKKENQDKGVGEA